jgi:hypothetical protein
MVDLDALATRARRTAEWSRARMACRIALVVALLGLVPLLGGAAPATCACLTVVLFAGAAFLRWRDRVGVEAVRDGLALGAVPLVAALFLRGCGVECASLGAIGPAEVACIVAGAVAGLGVTWRTLRTPVPRRRRRRRWLLTVLVASLTAALGCAGLGLGGVLAAVIALSLVAGVTWIPVALRAA